MTLAPELAGPAGPVSHMALSASHAVAPADTIPSQSGPSLTVSLTDGCEINRWNALSAVLGDPPRG